LSSSASDVASLIGSSVFAGVYEGSSLTSKSLENISNCLLKSIWLKLAVFGASLSRLNEPFSYKSLKKGVLAGAGFQSLETIEEVLLPRIVTGSLSALIRENFLSMWY